VIVTPLDRVVVVVSSAANAMNGVNNRLAEAAAAAAMPPKTTCRREAYSKPFKRLYEKESSNGRNHPVGDLSVNHTDDLPVCRNHVLPV
jgi:hypothetical protein